MLNFNNRIVRGDIREILAAPLDWHQFEGCNILITGINSMLGTYLTYLFYALNIEKGVKCRIYGLTRTISKSKELFRGIDSNGVLTYIVQDVTEPIVSDVEFHYVFHFAGNASPKAILEAPADIFNANVKGAYNVLSLALRSNSRRLVFASSREVYGKSETDALDEQSFGSLGTMEARSCYTESKRAVETLLHSYFLQYGVPSQSVRIAHSYGPGMKLGDGRIMSDLIGDAVNHRTLVLKSTGESKRSFIYISDTIIGILTATLLGEPGEAYNLSNETDEIRIRELARLIADMSGGDVRFEIEKNTNGYCNFRRVGLDNGKINSLGFNPSVSLVAGLERTLSSFEIRFDCGEAQIAQ